MTPSVKGIVTTSIVIAIAGSLLAAGLVLFSKMDRVTPDDDDWYVLVHGDVSVKSKLYMKDLRDVGERHITMALLGTGEDGLSHEYTGTSLTDIVLMAGPGQNASRIVVRAADAYSASFDLGVDGIYLVWEKDGCELMPRSKGGPGPVRLIADQGTVGTYNAQYCVRYVSEVIVE